MSLSPCVTGCAWLVPKTAGHPARQRAGSRTVRVRWPHPHARGVEDRFRDAVETERPLDRPVRERHRAERRESEPGRCQTERLTDVTGFEEHRAVRARTLVPPARPFEDRSEEHERG